MPTTKEVIILGSGPAGLTAAIYLGRFGHQPLVLGGLTYGGQITWTNLIENYPGFPEGISGLQLSQNFLAQAEKASAQILVDEAVRVDLSHSPFGVWTSDSVEPEYLTKALVIATGSRPIKLGLPNEDHFIGRGLAFCATCDGPLYRGQTIAVVGGGNSALEEACLLSQYASQVYLIHRRSNWSADLPLIARLSAIDNIIPVLSHRVAALCGSDKLTHLEIEDLQSHKTRDLEVSGIFYALGTQPVNELFASQLPLGSQGEILTKNTTNPECQSCQTATSIPGVFVAGDIRHPKYKQIAVAVGDGALAGIDAARFLETIN